MWIYGYFFFQTFPHRQAYIIVAKVPSGKTCLILTGSVIGEKQIMSFTDIQPLCVHCMIRLLINLLSLKALCCCVVCCSLSFPVIWISKVQIFVCLFIYFVFVMPRIRICEGFHYAASGEGIVNMVTELQMKVSGLNSPQALQRQEHRRPSLITHRNGTNHVKRSTGEVLTFHALF